MLGTFLQRLQKEGYVNITVRVRPSASQSRVTSVLQDESIKIDLAAPADDNKANIELVKFLAEAFGVAAANITILSGKTARVKLVRVALS